MNYERPLSCPEPITNSVVSNLENKTMDALSQYMFSVSLKVKHQSDNNQIPDAP